METSFIHILDAFSSNQVSTFNFPVIFSALRAFQRSGAARLGPASLDPEGRGLRAEGQRPAATAAGSDGSGALELSADSDGFRPVASLGIGTPTDRSAGVSDKGKGEVLLMGGG